MHQIVGTDISCNTIVVVGTVLCSLKYQNIRVIEAEKFEALVISINVVFGLLHIYGICGCSYI